MNTTIPEATGLLTKNPRPQSHIGISVDIVTINMTPEQATRLAWRRLFAGVLSSPLACWRGLRAVRRSTAQTRHYVLVKVDGRVLWDWRAA